MSEQVNPTRAPEQPDHGYIGNTIEQTIKRILGLSSQLESTTEHMATRLHEIVGPTPPCEVNDVAQERKDSSLLDNLENAVNRLKEAVRGISHQSERL